MNEVNPFLYYVAIIVTMIVFLITIFIYIPRLEKLRKLEQKIEKLKTDRDYAIAQWSISMVSTNADRQKILKLLKEAKCRTKQSNDIRVQLANAYDRLVETIGKPHD